MTSLLEGARRLVARGSDLGGRIEALQSAVEAARGRLDDDVVDEAHEVVQRAAARLRLSADHTVVAIAGATGLIPHSPCYFAPSGPMLSTVSAK